ncbi:F0F1 ATP synthase subunit gamma [Desulforhopalus vacuolatus]|uniref:F0F1 ATP synthase subunit gamma n=1 Tax=Desulforhopalus vacuolatus TaxID=40414 RepID=UPI001966B847|nr:F0F1 ATP synthase subunit gamma [Desulforhopalus vacuolatus]MBM9518957.1 F0F1 ATP synthase subunit gamma [Desulforhopalus vacuolatus]
MSDTIASLGRQISGAGDLQSVVRTMKAVAASSIGQYEKSVRALSDYHRTVELGLGACFREKGNLSLRAEGTPAKAKDAHAISAVVFGSDQGLVGQFNDVVATFAVRTFSALSVKPEIWTVGERVHDYLADSGMQLVGQFAVPNTVEAITPFVGKILMEAGERHSLDEGAELYLFYNRPASGSLYTQVSQRLLPLDEKWRDNLAERPWPSGNLPEVIGDSITTLQKLISEYLFVSIFRACAESLASENASRLAAMQRADNNISELLEELNRTFHHLRQSNIDEELFDVISGFEALNGEAN